MAKHSQVLGQWWTVFGPLYVRQLETGHLNLKVQFRTSMQIWVFRPWRIIPYSVTVTVTGLWSNFWWLSSWKGTQNLSRSYITSHPNNLYGFYFLCTILHGLHICLSLYQIHGPSPNNTGTKENIMGCFIKNYEIINARTCRLLPTTSSVIITPKDVITLYWCNSDVAVIMVYFHWDIEISNSLIDLTQWGRQCRYAIVNKVCNGSGNGLSPVSRQAIT